MLRLSLMRSQSSCILRLSSISKSAMYCVGKRPAPKVDYGSCTGEILGASAFDARRWKS